MISKIYSLSINGLNTNLIEIEVDINNGLPSFTIVGLPDQGVQESRERLRSALKSSNFKLPNSRITVNMAPADIKKSGPFFDLAISVGILYGTNVISSFYLGDSIFIGELGLDGRLRKVNGILPIVLGSKEKGFNRVFIPYENIYEASIIPGIDIIGVKNLSDLIFMLNKDRPLTISDKIDFNIYKNNKTKIDNDFKYIIGQEHAKRALEIAASGGHNIIMSGPPGSGKTMLSKAFRSILPEMTIDESIEVSKIYSVSGLLSLDNPLIINRPFRTVHHTASSVSIIGGGRNASPGEISLSHRGVLFLDEILEFNKSVLEVLRQPLEDGKITINRANASFSYPAKFILVASMNPCPCGYLSDPDKECVDTPEQIRKYKSKLSGPLLDRIDIFIEVPKVKTEKLEVIDDYSKKETSENIKNRVTRSRNIQIQRFKGTNIKFNSEMGTKDINKYCKLDGESSIILKQAVNNMKLSARSYFRILKLSRTIADLNGYKDIKKEHILESLSYRKKEEY